MTLGKGPEDGVSKAVLAEVGKGLLLDLEGGEVGYCRTCQKMSPAIALLQFYLRDWVMASSENASIMAMSKLVALTNLL